MSCPTKRITALREKVFVKKEPSIRSAEGELLWYRGWLANHDAGSSMMRHARAKTHMLANASPVYDDGELLVGKPCYRALAPDEMKELADCRKWINTTLYKTEGQDSHMAIDYEKLLILGIVGIQQEIESFRTALNLDVPENLEKEEFYKAALEALEGVLQYAEHYADYIQELADGCGDSIRKTELAKIAAVLRRVPRHPAQTFGEALQSVHFITFCLEGLYQLGRPDRYLIDYYQRDIENGSLTEDDAQELIDCLCILYNEYIPKGLAVGFMVGGADASGRDVTNALTWHFIESIGHTRMIYPSIGLCCTQDTPRDLLLRCCQLLSEGLSHPALFNDALITRSLKQYGLAPEEACLYIQSTCVEITPIAASAVWVASPYINLVQILLDLMEADSPEPDAAFQDFDNFKRVYRQHLGDKIRRETIEQNRLQLERYHHGGNPLVSCFVKDCIKRGRDIDQGGARYNWIMPTFVGLANLTDSFVTIERLVFQENRLSMEQLARALQKNFSDDSLLRLEILNRLPKYGNDVEEVDLMVQEITGWIVEEISRYKTWRGDRFIPSLFCWVMHERLGSETSASPDGRLWGFPLGDGSGPAQGREKKGPTASICSSTKWDHGPFIGGVAVNLKFGRSLFTEESMERMLDLIRTYMERGGFELQINVVDSDVLTKARKNPEAYQDLVVRVGGYSDYFVHLTPAMQEEVIMRTAHGL